MSTMNLTELAAIHGEKAAVVMAETGEAISYRRLNEQSNQIAHLFRDLGLEPGDHVAFLMENGLDLFPMVWAAQRSGLLYTPVNWHLTADEAAYVVENCGARVLVHSVGLAPLAERIHASVPQVRNRFVVSGPAADGAASLAEEMSERSTAPIGDEVEGYYMLYSSGTTGKPKGILPELTGAPFGAGLAIDATMRDAFGFGADSVYLSPGPLYHAAPLGWSLGTIRNGGTAVVMERFDAEVALSVIERYAVTHAQFVPTMFVRMLKLPESVRAGADVSSLRTVIHAAAPCPIEVKEQIIEWFGPKVTEFYAGSEGNGFFMITTPEWLAHRGSVGKPMFGQVHICDDSGVELPVGEVGTIWMSGVPRFEYHGEPDKTSSVYNNSGWSTLGDLGHVDEDGYLYLSARRTDLILSGGVNIYPQEAEDVLTMHPAVFDVAVIGVPDDEMGQRVHAIVSTVDGVEPNDELASELIEFARSRLSHFKAPRTVEFGEVPRLPSGKLLKRALLDGR